MINGSVHQDIQSLIYMHLTTEHKAKTERTEWEIDKITVIFGDINIPLSVISRTSRQHQ